MLKKLHLHQYRCLQNFELNFSTISSTLLLGESCAGKSTILNVMELLQEISRGVPQIGELICQ